MTVQNAGSGRVEGFACDGCPESYEVDEPCGFSEAWEAAKAEGWSAFKGTRGWEHYCRRCTLDRRNR